MDRETRTIKTPLGKEAVLKIYLTARERNELRSIFLQNLKIETATQQIKEIEGAVIEKAEIKLLELILVSYDGSAEGILTRLLDGRPEEYDFIVQEANRISNAANFKKAE